MNLFLKSFKNKIKNSYTTKYICELILMFWDMRAPPNWYEPTPVFYGKLFAKTVPHAHSVRTQLFWTNLKRFSLLFFFHENVSDIQ